MFFTPQHEEFNQQSGSLDSQHIHRGDRKPRLYHRKNNTLTTLLQTSAAISVYLVFLPCFFFM